MPPILLSVLLFAVGLVLLIKGGDWFVDGATGIARRFRIPDLLIGATVVSIGTTLPEVMVSATSAVSGHGEIAYGNAIGSIICNTALIAAITIAIRPAAINRATLVKPAFFFFGAVALYTVVAYVAGYFSRPVGIVLLVLFFAYMVTLVFEAKKSLRTGASEDEVVVEGEEQDPIWKDTLFLIVGAALIAIGADLLVDHGTIIARELGVPEAVIALTFVALGTSLPELVTAITSLAKGHGALSLGNIIGANLFNLVLVSGVSVTLSPFAIPAGTTLFGINSSLVLDIPVMLCVMGLLVLPALLRGKLSKWQGILLLCIYAAFCALQFCIPMWQGA
jgi:cation:H+ antiporter